MPIRTPDQRLRVFISSTLQELAEERAAVREAVTRLRLTPVLFELGARPHPPQELYRAYIAQSHLFVGIYWQSYGWVGPGMEISGLEDEYLLSASLPRLIYIKTPASDREPRLSALLDRIRDEGSLSYKSFSTAAELGDLVADDLALMLSEGFTAASPLGSGPWPVEPPHADGPAAATDSGRIRVMIVDDHVTVRSGLAAFLSASDDFELVAEAADGAEAVRLCPQARPDVVLMDMVMPVMDGAAATEEARRVCPDLQVIALTSFKQEELVQRALAAGAIGYLLKNVSADDLASAIRSAHAGRSTLSPEAAQVMIKAAAHRPARPADTGRLPVGESERLAVPAAAWAHAPLPVPPTPLVGREAELDYLEPLLLDDTVRLVTLTGVGGCGKTRLALAIAWGLSDRFSDGASFVSLATVRDPQRVVAAVCAALAIPDVAGWSREETLSAFLAGKHLLLVLDNLEQVVEAAPVVTELLQAAPGLTILVTSRTPLRIRGEREYVVPPLPVPGPEVPVALANAGHFAALRLFAERARDAHPGFALSDDNVRTVAEICRRLDGLPLALELAAARSRLLSPAALLARLEHPLDALGDGLRDLPDRQRSLRTTLAWSHQLLDDTAQRLFRRLSVFVGGWTLEAAEAACADPQGADDPIDVIGGMETLIEASLVERHERPAGDVRFSMLETVRGYAAERLAADGADEEAGLRHRHAHWFRELADRADRGLRSPERSRWRARLEDDFDNLRGAVTWSCSPAGDPDVGAWIAWGLCWYWEESSHTDEANQWIGMLRACRPGTRGRHPADADRADAVDGAEPRAAADHVAARLEVVAGCLGWLRNDLTAGRTALEEAVALLGADGPAPVRAYALALLAMIDLAEGRALQAVELLEAAASYAREAGDPWCAAFVSYWRGDALTAAGRADEAWAYNQEGLSLFRATGDPWGVAIALFSIGWLHYAAGDLDAARSSMEESAHLLRQTDDRWGVSWALASRAFLLMQAGDLDPARALFEEALQLGRDYGNPASVVVALSGMAGIAVARRADGRPPTTDDARRAARLLGAAASQRERTAVMPWSFDNIVLPTVTMSVRGHLEDETFGAEHAAGKALSAVEATTLAMG